MQFMYSSTVACLLVEDNSATVASFFQIQLDYRHKSLPLVNSPIIIPQLFKAKIEQN